MNYTPASPCRILVLHPDPLVRAGIMTSLREHAPFSVHVSDCDADTPAADPIDMVIADYQQAMYQTGPASVARRSAFAARRIVIVTTNEREIDIQNAMKAGVHGYILLKAPLSEFVEGVATVASGSRYMSLVAAQRIADSLSHEPLTSREVEVLRQLVTGDCNKAIARCLNIEVGTVKTHVRAIFSKLDASTRTQAVSIAIARGLVEARLSAGAVPLPMPIPQQMVATHAST